MDSPRSLKASLQGTLCAVIGVACALMVLEIQRMPVGHPVSFSMFAPVPYICEAVLIGAVGIVLARRRRHLAALAAARVIVAVAAALATWLLMWGAGFSDAVMVQIRIVYRISTGLLVVLWGERLIGLGAWRAACVIAVGCFASGVATLALAFVPQEVVDGFLGLLPVVAGVALAAFRPDRCPAVTAPALPTFTLGTARERVVAVGLVALPLLCRATTISTQHSWMQLQQQSVASTDIQAAIGAAIIIGAVAIGLILRFAWNRSFVLVFDLVVVPVTFMAFYTASLADDLWALHFLIVDSTYKVVLFYVLMAPFLFPSREGGLVSSTPLYGSFAFLIAARALFSGLHALLPASAYAALAVVTVLVVFAVASVLALLYVHQHASAAASRGAGEGAAAGVPGAGAPGSASASEAVGASGIGAAAAGAPTPVGAPVRPAIDRLCAAVGDRFELTPRERDVLFLLVQNYRAPYIAEKLVVSQSTVKTHMRNLYGKLGVHSQAELLLLIDREAEEQQPS